MTFGPRRSSGHSAHIGQEVEVYYRGHPLYGRRVRRHYSEQRVAGRCVHVEAEPGVIISVAAWMLDPVACAGMEIGVPRATVAALSDLHQLLIERGFRGSSRGDSSIVQEEQDDQLTKTDSAKTGAVHGPSPARHCVQFHPASGNEPVGARESDYMLGQRLDASGRHRGGGAR